MKILLTVSSSLIFLSLSACVGATLSDKSSLEEYPNRSATEDEAKRLKKCLKGIHSIQSKHYQQHQAYIEKTSKLPADDYCNSLRVTLAPQEEGFLAFASMVDGDVSVKWSVNEKGQIIEYTDPGLDEELF